MRIFNSKSCGEARLLAPWSEAVILLVLSLVSVTCLFASGCAAVDFRGFAATLFSFTPEFLWCPFLLDRCLEKKGAPTHRLADVLSDQWKDCQAHAEASKRHAEKAQSSRNFSLMTCPPGFFAPSCWDVFGGWGPATPKPTHKNLPLAQSHLWTSQKIVTKHPLLNPPLCSEKENDDSGFIQKKAISIICHFFAILRPESFALFCHVFAPRFSVET